MLQQSYVKNFSNFLRWNKQNMNWIDWILISAKSTTNFNYVGFHEDCPREGKGPWKYKCKLKWINPIYSWPTKMTLNRLKKPTLCFPTPLSHSHICSLRHIEEPNSFSPFSIFTLKLRPPFSKFFSQGCTNSPFKPFTIDLNRMKSHQLGGMLNKDLFGYYG